MKVLLMTVGTGSPEDLEGTIFSPFLKSMMAGQYELILLLPSEVSGDNARLLMERSPDLPVEIRSLRKAGDENNLEECYSQFDAALAGLATQKRVKPEDITVDFTRGTKVMSAALSMAAVAHGIRRHRYLERPQTDPATNAVIAGTEVVQEFSPVSAFARVSFEHAREFLHFGHFQAASRILASLPTTGQFHDSRWLQWAARMWGAWDYFHYAEALKLAARSDLPMVIPPQAQPYLPGDDQIELLKNLAGVEPAKRPANRRAPAARAIAADLLANARRRLNEGQFEEVLVRAYRVLELIGQIRLFTYGLDSASADADHPAVVRWISRVKYRPRLDPEGRFMLARENVAGLLEVLNDRLASRLTSLEWLGAYSPNARNRCILAHGFRSKTEKRENDLVSMLAKIEGLFWEEDPANADLSAAARFRFLASK